MFGSSAEVGSSIDMSDPVDDRTAVSSTPGFHVLIKRSGLLWHSDINLVHASLHTQNKKEKKKNFIRYFFRKKKQKGTTILKGERELKARWALKNGKDPYNYCTFQINIECDGTFFIIYLLIKSYLFNKSNMVH